MHFAAQMIFGKNSDVTVYHNKHNMAVMLYSFTTNQYNNIRVTFHTGSTALNSKQNARFGIIPYLAIFSLKRTYFSEFGKT